MVCPESLLEKLVAEMKLLETQITRLNAKVSEQCPDSGIQQEFSRIKAALKTMERSVEEILAQHTVTAG